MEGVAPYPRYGAQGQPSGAPSPMMPRGIATRPPARSSVSRVEARAPRTGRWRGGAVGRPRSLGGSPVARRGVSEADVVGHLRRASVRARRQGTFPRPPRSGLGGDARGGGVDGDLVDLVDRVGRCLSSWRPLSTSDIRRLRVLPQKLAAALKTQAALTEKIDVSRVAAVMRNLAAVAAKDPEEARRVLADVVESVVLRLSPDGYVAEVTLKNETAAIAGGRVLGNTGCGGRI